MTAADKTKIIPCVSVSGYAGGRLIKKPRRVCRPQAANKLQSVFCGGVYVAKTLLILILD